jgi:hypothetical protein
MGKLGKTFTALITLALAGATVPPPALAAPGATFVPLTPCRVADTRSTVAGQLASGETRSFLLLGPTTNFSAQGGAAGGCGLPDVGNGVVAAALNIVAVTPALTQPGFLRAWAGGTAQPTAAVLNYNKMTPELNIANGVIVPVRTAPPSGNDLNVQASRQTHVIIDVFGYFVDLTVVDGAGSGLDADLIDGLNSTQFLRSDTSNTFSSGTLTLGSGTFLALPDGTAASPSLRFSADTDTGIFRIGTNSLGFSTAGAQRLQITSTGNLVASGSLALGGVSGETLSWNATDDLFVLSDDLRLSGVVNAASGTAAAPSLSFSTDPDTGVYRATTNTLAIATGGAERGRFNSSGLTLPGDLTLSGGINHAGILLVNYDSDSADLGGFCLTNEGGSNIVMQVGVGDNPEALFDGAVTANGIDYAEDFLIDDQAIEPGDVVSLKAGRPEFIERSGRAYDPELIGVISGRPGFVTGRSFDSLVAADAKLAAEGIAAFRAGDQAKGFAIQQQLVDKRDKRQRSVALLGRVPVKVDAQYGPIRPGDHLTSSPRPGHAMAMTQAGRSFGIAIEGFNGPGQGQILAFIQPGWHGHKGDAAGQMPVSENVEEGDVLVADRNFPGALRRGDLEADTAVLGVAGGSSGFLRGGLASAAELDERLAALQVQDDFDGAFRLLHVPIAMNGTVLCKVDASFGAIRVGDLLQVSPTPGHAMVSPDAMPGTILGKALEPLEKGKGKIRIAVILR